ITLVTVFHLNISHQTHPLSNKLYSSKISLQTTSASSATSKHCFEQPAASFLVCSLIFIEYKLSIAQLGRIGKDLK
ncbi:hypothetical protein, partial [Pseudomonas aeruginosa]|uniref:hypothetical protein n=1 Tax=Pseudomonas aeruginosa TaxID=287 RepID=UPI001E65CF6D